MATTIQDGGLPSTLLDAMNPKKSTNAAQSSVDETQDRFMKLLVTQMQNQDPLNPLDNAEVTSQFAQLSTVTGVNKLNDSLASLMASYQSNQTLQAASMIGHGVLTSGSSIDLKSGNALLGVDLSDAADKVAVTIRDAAGNEVRTLQLGPQQAGSLPLTWDGKANDGSTAPDGHYSFEVAATSNSAKVNASTLQFGLVNTVTADTKGIKLNVEGLGAVGLADVKQIL